MIKMQNSVGAAPCKVHINAVDATCRNKYDATHHTAVSVSETPHADRLVLFGFDLSSQSPSIQFVLSACGVFAFTIVYGYLQELLAVRIAGRKYALFLATCQFAGYAFWSLVLTRLRSHRHHQGISHSNSDLDASTSRDGPAIGPSAAVPWRTYVALSLIRAIDLGMTNLAMQFINYPTKILMKSSRVVFTMILGLIVGNKRYGRRDYTAASFLVIGLGIFLHADSREQSVVFHPVGILMMVVSLLCDGTFGNWSEVVMKDHRVGHDEFQLHLYFLAFLAMIFAAHARGELVPGIEHFFLEAGTVAEIESDDAIGDDPTWTVRRKVLVLFFFSTTGLLGSSCAGAITKHFGALAFSITSTARKAMTLFLSFVVFHNTCTFEHVAGMIIFIGALIMKSLFAKAKANAHACDDAAKEAVISDDEASTCSTASMHSSGDDFHDDEEASQETRSLIIRGDDDASIDLEAANGNGRSDRDVDERQVENVPTVQFLVSPVNESQRI